MRLVQPSLFLISLVRNIIERLNHSHLNVCHKVIHEPRFILMHFVPNSKIIGWFGIFIIRGKELYLVRAWSLPSSHATE